MLSPICSSLSHVFFGRLGIVKGSPGAAVKLLPCDHEVKSLKRPLAEMQGNAAYIRPKLVGPYPEPCASGSYVYRAALFRHCEEGCLPRGSTVLVMPQCLGIDCLVTVRGVVTAGLYNTMTMTMTMSLSFNFYFLFHLFSLPVA
jgi:hypothetical protein